jgi:hypothetical protein
MRAAAATMMSFALATGGAACGKAHTSEDAGARFDAGRPDGGRRDAMSSCTSEDSARELAEAPAIAAEADACFSGYVQYEAPGADPVVTFGAYGGGYPMLSPCRDSPETQRAQEEMTARVRAALEARGLDCAEGFANVPGGAQTDLQSMTDRVNDCGPLFDFGNQVRILLDPAGVVVDVRTEPPHPELEDCLRTALAGLSFPCLASFEVCPEFAIAE